MFEMKGLDKLTSDLETAQRALANLDGELGTVSFDPEDPASIEAAIASVEQMLDEKVGRYAGNPFVGPLIEATKERYREAILDRAAQARLAGDAD